MLDEIGSNAGIEPACSDGRRRRQLVVPQAGAEDLDGLRIDAVLRQDDAQRPQLLAAFGNEQRIDVVCLVGNRLRDLAGGLAFVDRIARIALGGGDQHT